MLFRTMQQAKHFTRIFLGFVLLVLGIVAIPTPVPGLLLVGLGLGILAADFDWAQRLLAGIKLAGLRARAALAVRRVAPTPETDPQ